MILRPIILLFVILIWMSINEIKEVIKDNKKTELNKLRDLIKP